MLNTHQFGDHIYNIRTDHSKYVGTADAYYRKQKVGSLTWSADNGEIGDVVVDAAHRRRGLATRLLRAAKDHAREHDLPALQHNVVRTDAGEAWAKSTGDQLPWRLRAEDM